ncbi:MAG: hypothetical protein KKD86_02695 [Bacteroidetes bacterium]|nr:hypothetical protein [Bacteroidota bacterium]
MTENIFSLFKSRLQVCGKEKDSPPRREGAKDFRIYQLSFLEGLKNLQPSGKTI